MLKGLNFFHRGGGGGCQKTQIQLQNSWPKKESTKKRRKKKLHFSTDRQSSGFMTFLLFCNTFNQFLTQHESLRFQKYQQNFVRVFVAFLVFYGSLKLNEPKLAQKRKNVFYKCVLDLNLRCIPTSVFSISSTTKKVKITRPYNISKIDNWTPVLHCEKERI